MDRLRLLVAAVAMGAVLLCVTGGVAHSKVMGDVGVELNIIMFVAGLSALLGLLLTLGTWWAMVVRKVVRRGALLPGAWLCAAGAGAGTALLSCFLLSVVFSYVEHWWVYIPFAVVWLVCLPALLSTYVTLSCVLKWSKPPPDA